MNKHIINSYRERILEGTQITKEIAFKELKPIVLEHNLILVGLRAVGKIRLSQQLTKYFLKEHVSKPGANPLLTFASKEEQFISINLNSFPEQTSDLIIKEVSGKDYKVVLINDMQLIHDWNDVLSSLIDKNPDTRFIITISNTSSLKTQEPQDRYKIFNIHPLTLQEYKKSWSNNEFDKYLFYGSFPKTTIDKDPIVQYNEMINEKIIHKILLEDSKGLKQEQFNDFSKALTSYIGSEINITKIANLANMTRGVCYSYLEKLQDSQFIKSITKFNSDDKYPKEKIYFSDKGMIPYFSNEVNYYSLIENLVFASLSAKYDFEYQASNIQYYEDKNHHGFDFIIKDQKILIEIKFMDNVMPELISSRLNHAIIDELKDYKKIVITKTAKKSVNGWEFIPLLEFLEDNNG